MLVLLRVENKPAAIYFVLLKYRICPPIAINVSVAMIGSFGMIVIALCRSTKNNSGAIPITAAMDL